MNRKIKKEHKKSILLKQRLSKKGTQKIDSIKTEIIFIVHLLS